MKVLLVSMPFAALARPSLGLSLLKARLTERDVACDVAYLNLAFGRLLGREDYDAILDDLPYTALAGEWVFAECLYGRHAGLTASFIEDVLQGPRNLAPAQVDPVLRSRSLAPRFIAESLDAVPWAHYGLVGFTSSGPQNIAALALARRVKEAYPWIHIIFGGQNWEDVMGRELHRRFSFVDFVCPGEADDSFPALVELLHAGDVGFGEIPGVVFRAGGRTRITAAAAHVEDLDALPVPDHSDYFGALAASGEAGRLPPVVPLEASRGCWWAARQPCRFCGLSGVKRAYRAKSPQRILDELWDLVRRWECLRLDIVDNVVPDGFLDEVLPMLAARPLPVPLSLEVRPTLREEHVRLMKTAGVSIQSGVESLSDSVLRRMGKGTTSIQNIRLLKWCKVHGVALTWNLLYGFPGETSEEYEQMSRLLPSVRFLDPPAAVGPLSLERFSRYFERPEVFGIRHVRPCRAYRYIYPFPDQALRRIAYFFEFDHPSGPDRPGYVHRLHSDVRVWRRKVDAGDLRLAAQAGGQLALVDTRPGAVARDTVLDAVDSLVYAACDDGAAEHEIAALLRTRRPDLAVADDDLRSRLSSLVDRRAMVVAGDRYLSLALPAAGCRSPE